MLLATTGSAMAATWQQVTGDVGSNTVEVAFARKSTTGPLHVIWSMPTPGQAATSSRNRIGYRPVSTAGVLGSASSVRPNDTDWTGSFANPAMAYDPVSTHLNMFTAEPYDALYGGDAIRFLSATPTGWILTGAFGMTGGYATENFGAQVTPAGVQWAGWTHQGKPISSHSPGPTEDQLSTASDGGMALGLTCCQYYPNIAMDGSNNTVVMGWYSNMTNRHGLEIVRLDPTPSTSAMYVPNSASNYGGVTRSASISPSGRMAITGRMGTSGIYTAYCVGYPTCTKVNVWRWPSGPLKTIRTGTNSLRHVGIAKAPGGRLWVFWYDATAGKIMARRSNPAATAWGPVIKVSVPTSSSSIWRLSGDGQLGGLDLFAHATTSVTATYYTRLKQQLTITPSKRRIRVGKRIRFKVTDAGVAVSGAKVKFQGRTRTTNAAGFVRFRVKGPGGRRYKARATRSSYTAASVRVRVLPRA